MCFRQQSRLENGGTTGQGGGDINGAHQAVFRNAKGDLDERGWNHCCGWILLPFAPILGILWIEVASRQLGLSSRFKVNDVDGRKQGMQSSSQHRLSCSTPASNDHAA